MTNRVRTLGVAGAGIAAFLVALYAAAAFIIPKSFLVLEDRQVREDTRRAVAAFHADVAGLDYITRDWATWDDTYAFVRGKNPGYVKANVAPGTLSGLRVDLLLYFTADAGFVYGTGFDRQGSRLVPVPASIWPHVRSGMPLVKHASLDRGISGLVMLPDGPMVVASRPVLTSDGRGPIAGTLIFGRYFTAAELDRLAGLTHFTLLAARVDHPGLRADLAAAFSALKDAGASDLAVHRLSDTGVAGYAVLRDIYRSPALLLRATVSRDIFQQGQNTMRYFLMGLVLVGVVFGGGSLLLFDRLVLLRLAKRESEHRYQELFDHASDAIVVSDLGWTITGINQAGERLTGYRKDHAAGMNLARLIAPDDVESVRRLLAAVLAGEIGSRGELHILTQDGRMIPVEVTAQAIFEGAKPVGFQTIARDITARRQAEALVRESEERYALAVRGANDGMWDWNLASNEIYLSARWREMLGLEAKGLWTTPEEWFNRVHGDDILRLRAAIKAHLDGFTPHLEFEYRMWHTDNTHVWILTRGLAVRDEKGVPLRLAGSQTNITKRKVAELQLVHDALHDSLTGLPNRTLFLDRLGQTLRRRSRDGHRFAVLFLDLDRLKIVNDSLGHSSGDELLRWVGRRLQMNVRAADTVARLSGDEFAVLVDETVDGADAVGVARRIQEVIGQPFQLGGHEVRLTASIGVAPSAPEYTLPEDYLRNADTAMYRAKELGTGRCVTFAPEMHARALALLQMEADLRRAIDVNEFRLVYQPIVALRTGSIMGFEALLRWVHPRRGLVPPGEFVPVAEDTGLIVPIGRWVLREAARQAREWQGQFPSRPPLYVSVNLSRRQLGSQSLVDEVEQILTQTGLDPRTLHLEITENAIMEDIEASATILSKLKALEVTLLVDDFGTGYSSLGALRRFPISTFKIDRSFVNSMTTDDENSKIVRALLTLSRNLNMGLVAEGVETIDQVAQLRALGCEYAQGYYFSKPIGADEVLALLERQAREGSAFLSVIPATRYD